MHNKQIGNINQKIKTTTTEVLAFQNTMHEMKITLDGFNSKLNTSERSVNLSTGMSIWV